MHYAECRILFTIMLSLIILFVIMLNVVMLKVIVLKVVMLNVVMLKVIVLKVIMLNVVKLNVVKLNVVMLSVIMLNAVAPNSHLNYCHYFLVMPLKYVEGLKILKYILLNICDGIHQPSYDNLTIILKVGMTTFQNADLKMLRSSIQLGTLHQNTDHKQA